MSAKGTIQIRTAVTDVAAATGPILVLENNPQRVWIVLTPVGGGGGIYAGLDSTGLYQSCFTALYGGQGQTFLRKDYGALVASEIWLSNGLGNAPSTDTIVVEAVLIGE